MSNIVFLLQKHSFHSPNKSAYIFLEDGLHETARISYHDLDKLARSIAAHLQTQNAFGQRFLLLYPSGIEFIAAFMGCLYAGAIAVPLRAPRENEFKQSISTIKAVAKDADVLGILTLPTYFSDLQKDFSEELECNQSFIIDTTQIDNNSLIKYKIPKITGDVIAYLQYTSGSTSTPKGVVIKHNSLTISLKNMAKVWNYSKDSVSLTWSPHSHVYGLLCGLLVPLYHGTPSVIMPTDAFIRRPLSWLEAITKYKITNSGCPNFGYDMCVDAITDDEIKKINLVSWKVAVNGGETVHSDTLFRFYEKFKSCGFKLNRFNSAYGMSEVTGAIAVTRYLKNPSIYKLDVTNLKNNSVVMTTKDSFYQTYVSNGYMLPKLEAVIVDPETRQPVLPGKIGEIWLRGKNVADGYWQRQTETKEIFQAQLYGTKKKYFRTGDLGFIYKNEICLTGRLKNLIVIHGKKYNPLDLELTVKQALKTYSLNEACVIFSTSISEKEAVILLQEVPEGLPSVVLNKISQTIYHSIMQNFGIAIYKIILVKSKSIPRTNSGKIQLQLCQEHFQQNKLNIVVTEPDAVSAVTPDTVIKLIASVLKINVDQIDLDYPLSGYQIDSIKVIQITSLLNEKCHFSLSPAKLYEYQTLGEFIKDISLIENKADTENIAIAKSVKNKDIAIVGMSGIFPEADNIDEFWNNLIQGNDCIKEIPADRWDWKSSNGEAGRWGGFINNLAHFDADFFSISPREAELIDPQQRLLLQVAWQAIEDAGYSSTELARQKVGFFVGAFNHDYAELLQQQGLIDAYITTGALHSILANRVSYALNLRGPSETIDTACSSSLVALHHAVTAIQNGECHSAIVGGVNLLLSPTSYRNANKARMLSEDGRCKTFDERADGYVRSEGIIALVLKPLEEAQQAGDHVYGLIKGTAVNHGGHVSSITVPNPNAQADVIIQACERANIDVGTINIIETHGTGTAIGDPIEINGLKKAFNTLAERNAHSLRRNSCGLGAVKSNIGHLEAAAGLAGIVKVLLAMKYEKFPANLHFQNLNTFIELENTPFYIIDSHLSWPNSKSDIPRRAGVSSFGFGGTNAHVILEEPPEFHPEEKNKDIFPYAIALSAKSENALRKKVNDLEKWIKKQKKTVSLAALSYTSNIGRDHFEKRCVFVVESIEELINLFNQIRLGNHPENFIINYLGDDKNQTRLTSDENLKSLIDDIKVSSSSVEIRSKLIKLAGYYVHGLNVDWKQIHHGNKQRISLPTYPFEKKYYWMPIQSDQPNEFFEPNDHTESFNKSVNNIQHDFIKQVSRLLKVPHDKIKLDIPLSEMGLDSLSFKQFAIELEKLYGIELSPAIFYTHNNIDSLSQYLIETYPDQIKKIYPYESHIKTKHIPSNYTTVKKTNFKHSNESIAIIGMQGYFPQSTNLEEFWKNLIEGNDLITEVPKERWDWCDYYGDAKNDSTKTNSKWGGFLKEIDKFDAKFFNISAREANLIDPQQRLFLEITWKTIEDAGYNPFELAGQEIGVFAGVEFSEYQTLISKQNIYNGHVSTGTSHALLANRVSYFLNWQGPSEVISTACSSSLVAVHRAVNAIYTGECSMAIAGGVSLMLTPETFLITSQLGALSPDGRCKTFDKSANGYVKGEGIAAILLKPLQQAQQDGDSIYGIIKATHVNHGGKAQSLTAPNANTQKKLLIRAYNKAGINIDTVNYIETHGTGTELGDPIEVEGLKEAFKVLLKQKDKKGFCGLGSVKSNIGHLEPASGMAGLIKVLLSMRNEKIPGNLHFKELNPYINIQDTPFYIIEKNQEWSRLIDENGTELPRRAGVSSFGFGGTCAHVVLEEYIQNQPSVNVQHKPYYLITLSAKEREALNQKIIELYDWIKINFTRITLEDLSITLNLGRTHFDIRCAIIVSSIDELLDTLQSLLNNQRPDNCILNSGQDLIQYSPLFSEIYRSVIKDLSEYDKVLPQKYLEKLLLLGDLYTRQYQIDWLLLHANENNIRLSGLPTYPFIRQRYWFDEEMQQSSTEIKIPIITNIQMVKANLNDFVLNYLQNIFSEKLRVPPEDIDIDTTYEAFGVDSLIVLEITNRLESDFGSLAKTLLYERNTLSHLAKYFLNYHKEKLEQLAGQDTNQENCHIPQKDLKFEVDKTLSPAEIEKFNREDIAIIGIHGMFPSADNLDEFWKNLEQGKDCISEIPSERWNYKDYPVTVGGEQKFFKFGGFLQDIDKFDPLFFGISPRDAAFMDPQERLFLQTVWATLEDAGYTRERLKNVANRKVGVFAGVTYNFYPLYIAEEWNKGNQLPLDIQSFSIANRVSYFLDINGPSYVIDTACSSSLAAIHLACESIHQGESLMAIAGGVNLTLHPCKYHFLGSYSFMSEDGRCASFAEGGAGYVPSEGVGAVLLKPLSLALRDNDRIYGVIKSSSMNHGGKTSGYTVPNPNAQAELISSTLEKGQIDPRSISYLEAHGTGTALGDPIEIRGLQEAFEKFTAEKQFCSIGSVKSNIGHCESAAGISQLAKVVLQFQNKKLVPSIHSKKLNPFIDFEQSPFYVQRELSEWKPVNGYPRRAGISSFGAGGTNVHLIVDEYPSLPIKATLYKPFIFLLSALNAERLHEYAQKIYAYCSNTKNHYSEFENESEWLNQMCYTLQVGREAMATKLAFLFVDYADLMHKLKQFLDGSINNDIWINEDPKDKSKEKVDIDALINARQQEKLIKQWLLGTKINWSKLYEIKPQIITMPTYPFAKRRCWISSLSKSNTPEEKTSVNLTELQSITNTSDVSDWLYYLNWEKQPLNKSPSAESDNDRWLIFSDFELGYVLREELGNSNSIFCFIGNDFNEHQENVFYINPDNKENYTELLKRINKNSNGKIKGIIYLWPTLPEFQNNAISFRLLNLLQATLEQKWDKQLKFCLVTRNSQTISDAKPISFWQHSLWSIVRIFAAEQSDYQALLIDLGNYDSFHSEAAVIKNELRHLNSEENLVAYRNEERFANCLERFILPNTINTWQAPEAVIITGGLGSLGVEVAKWLINKGVKYLLLTGARPLPAKSDWMHSTDEKVTALLELEKLNAKILYETVDVIDKEAMRSIINQAQETWNTKIQGVFHLAGVTTDNIKINELDQDILKKVLSAKAQGALVLHELFDQKDLNCFVLFSSIASLPFFGMSGLSAYASANEFLNGLARFRRQQQLPAISIDWAAWSEKGMSHRYNHSKFLDAVGMSTISIKKGIEILNMLMNIQPENIVVFKVDWKKFLQTNMNIRRLTFFKHLIPKSESFVCLPIASSQEEVKERIISILARVLDLEIGEVNPESQFQNYGLDSIIGVNFVAELGQFYPEIVSPMDLYRYQTINQLAKYIMQSCLPLESESDATKFENINKTPRDLDNLSFSQISQLLEEEISSIDI